MTIKQLCSLALIFLGLGFGLNAQSTLPNHGFQALGHLAYPNDDLSNIWGYRAADSTEYALVGTQAGLSIVSLANPAQPQELFLIPGFRSIWREVRTYQDRAYFVCEQGRDGLSIVDLQHLPDSAPYRRFYPALPNATDSLFRVHTLHIDTVNGHLFCSGGNGNGVLIYDLASNALAPPLLGSSNLSVYAHDCYGQGTKLYTADMLSGTASIYDLSQITQPQLLGSFPTPRNFAHNLWPLSSQSSIILSTDERAGAWLAAFDVNDPSDVQELDRWREGEVGGDTASIPHNVHVLNDFAFLSHYTSGVVVLDAKRPHNLVEVGRYDSYLAAETSDFYGCWGVYPYLPSGLVLLSDMQTGLHVLRPQNLNRACWLEGRVRDSLTGQGLTGADLSISVLNVQEQSKAQGLFALGHAQAGQYTVTISHAGYYSRSIQIDLQNDSLTYLDVALLPYPTAVQALAGNELKAYPNPSASGQFEISGEQAQIQNYLVFDALGRLCQEGQTPNALVWTLDLSNQAAGLYMVYFPQTQTQLSLLKN